MTARDFTPIGDSLRRSVIEFYADSGETLEGAAGVNTLETNSGYVERRAQPLLEMLRRRIGIDSIEGIRVLDLGCGFGALSAYFAGCGATVTGIDPIESRLEVGRSVAAEHGLPVRFMRGRMEDLDLADQSFEIAVQNNSLCYIISDQDRHSALLETARVLVPGGHVIIRNPNRWNPRDQFTGLPLIQLLPARQATSLAESLGRPRSDVRLTSPPEAARELRRAGFTNVAHVASPASRWPSVLKPIARYQHLIGQRPA
jgi:2-polyprenyl-3-methyl-5-hydroxy-6-metoxy-1,4-benzoquinol methylase